VDKNAITFLKGDNYKIMAERDSNHEPILTFCLIVDNYRTNNSDGKTFWLGWNIGLNKRKFDEGWFPKS
jgi:hypothetical protein